MTYFRHVNFKDRLVIELTGGIEDALLGEFYSPEVQTKIRGRLDQVIAEAKQHGYIGKDRKPRWFQSKNYETFLKEQLPAINRDLKLGIRV